MKSIEETYTMMTQIEHVLKRPGMYIGSTSKQTSGEWVFDTDSSKIVKKQVTFTPGFLKIFDEIITNAIDHSVRDNTVSKIHVNISQESGEISVKNDGQGIPVVIHQEHKVYVPELIFSNMLSGSNFDDNLENTGAGTNGLGSKAVVIFSKKFKIETVNTVNKLKFSQTFSENLSIKSKPKVSENSGKSYTKVTFTPDFEKFQMNCIDNDTYSLITRRVYELLACTNKKVSIYLNENKLPGKGLIDYSKYFLTDTPVAHEVNGNFEYVVFQSNEFSQVSFVNGNNTTNGGKHVDCIVNQITSGIKNLIETKKKIQNVKASVVKENLFIILNCIVVNPKFNSQTKEVMTSPVKDITVSESFLKKIYNSPITQEVIEVTSFKDRKKLDKDVSTLKKSKMIVKNLEDATNAGTSKSNQCSLFLTEGLSASSFAVSGLSVIGRANYGIFSLKGVVLNVREATQVQLLKNEEILNIKKIIGLHTTKKYETDEEFNSLRYSSIIILADQDKDGIHIAGLIMNFVHHYWPALIKRTGFVKMMRTPIVKVTKGKDIKNFYDERDYEDFLKIKSGNWVPKYYKGLGTSTSAEAKDSFKNIKDNLGTYISDPLVDKSFELAFDKKKADDRKVWLEKVPLYKSVRNSKNQTEYSEFINKDLIQFSNYDNVRSIPNIMDGLKPSQRKVLYTAFKRNITKEIKVAQFSASVAELTAYHHGEASLCSTIVNMAQNYTGTNNINLLEPCGNFGFRNHNGKDAASPRYIFTHLNEKTRSIFLKEDEDILEYNTDDGQEIEPKFYVPSIPMILVNGTVGIGTGYSTNIPSFNPEDIVRNIKLILNNKEPNELVPWYSGFKGTITKDENSFILQGIYIVSGKTIKITEIPISTSISDYKDFLETFEEFTTINNSTENDPDFTLKFKSETDIKKFNYKTLKLQQKINITNMHLFDTSSKIKKYIDPNDIIRDFLKGKLEFLNKRKEHLIKLYDSDIHLYTNKKRFLEDIIEDKINIYRKSKDQVNKILVEQGYPKINESYNYLTSLQVSSFTLENLAELEKNIKSTQDKKNLILVKSEVNLLLEDLDNLKK
jgi:DNA topoisomerase-2